jgi:hypothetical protein
MPKTAFKVDMSRILFLQFLFSSVHAGQKIGEKPLQKYSSWNIYVGPWDIIFSHNFVKSHNWDKNFEYTILNYQKYSDTEILYFSTRPRKNPDCMF